MISCGMQLPPFEGKQSELCSVPLNQTAGGRGILKAGEVFIIIRYTSHLREFFLQFVGY